MHEAHSGRVAHLEYLKSAGTDRRMRSVEWLMRSRLALVATGPRSQQQSRKVFVIFW